MSTGAWKWLFSNIIVNIVLLLDFDPYSEETCRRVGKLLGLTFFSGTYGTKGCYSYTSGYEGNIYFGTGEGDRTSDLEAPKYRPVGSEEFCRAAATKLKLTFSKDSWTTKGCYAYNDDAYNGKYKGKIYFSTGGTHEDNQNNPGSTKYRPEPCVPMTEKACKIAGKQLGKPLTASDSYSTKGCYNYNYEEDYTGTKYDGMYFGKGTMTYMTNPKTTVSAPKERPVIYTDQTIIRKNDCI